MKSIGAVQRTPTSRIITLRTPGCAASTQITGACRVVGRIQFRFPLWNKSETKLSGQCAAFWLRINIGSSRKTYVYHKRHATLMTLWNFMDFEIGISAQIGYTITEGNEMNEKDYSQGCTSSTTDNVYGEKSPHLRRRYSPKQKSYRRLFGRSQGSRYRSGQRRRYG